MTTQDGSGAARGDTVAAAVGVALFATCLLALLVIGWLDHRLGPDPDWTGSCGVTCHDQWADASQRYLVLTAVPGVGPLIGWLLMGSRRPRATPAGGLRASGLSAGLVVSLVLIDVVAPALVGQMLVVGSLAWAVALLTMIASGQSWLLWWRLRGYGHDRSAWYLAALATAGGWALGGFALLLGALAGALLGWFFFLLMLAALPLVPTAHVVGAVLADRSLRRRSTHAVGTWTPGIPASGSSIAG